MQIVIDIPKAMYDDIKSGKDGYSNYVHNSIRNGILLSKDHGRLIDYGYVVDAIDDWINAEEYRYTNATDYLRKRIENVPTIIEADTESEEV